MRVLVAGGVFRLSPEARAKRQPAPEVVLVDGLRRQGVDVRAVPLESLGAVARSSWADVVHVHHLSKAAVAAAASPFAAPLVFTAHGTAPPRGSREALGQWLIHKRMEFGVCLSAAERDWRARRSPSLAPKLTVIPNGLELPNTPPEQRHLAPSEDVRGLFVGQLIAIKQVHRIVEALKHEPRLRLELVFHNDQLLAELRETARYAGVLDRMKFTGQLSGPELFEAYRRSHVLFLPSLSEALPSVITEALSTGLPVIASRVGGIASQVGNAGILIGADGANEVARVMPELIDRYDDLSRCAVQRGDKVKSESAVSPMIQRHIDLYRHVTESVS